MKNDNNGFTIIEVIVVMAIICTVALIATPSVKQHYINSQIENLKADIEALKNAGMMYYFDHGEYPINYENLEDFVIDPISNEDNVISKLIMNVYASSPETQEAVKVASINEEKIKDYIGKLNYEIESYVMTTKGTVLHGEGIPDINGHLIHHYLESENVNLEDIINKEPILNQGGKLINNDRPNPPNVEIIEDVNIIVDGGPGTEVKLGVNGGLV
jgi:prepilin-type N-terminal cleavage/methylation domain-containing protein